jgi:hypothetical protein
MRIYMYMYIYVYIYINEKERERKRESQDILQEIVQCSDARTRKQDATQDLNRAFIEPS